MRFAVEYGITDPSWVPAMADPGSLTAFARAAEESGFAGLGVTDHPAPSTRWKDSDGEGSADPIASLAFCAAVTSRIRLISLVLVAGYRNPLLAAHQIATVDRLSAGRLTLGLGTGYLRSEFRALGADFDRRRESFDEALDVMRAAWTTKDLHVDGTGFVAPGTHMRPPLVQHPHPPLWLHGNGPWGRRRAARYGQGIIALSAADTLSRTIRTVPLAGLDDLRRAVDDFAVRLTEAGRDIADVDVVIPAPWPRLDVRRGWDADALRADVEALAKIGATWLVVTTRGDDPAAAEDTVRRFGAEIVTPLAAG